MYPSVLVKSSDEKMRKYSDTLPLVEPHYTVPDRRWRLASFCSCMQALSFIAFRLTATVVAIWIFNEKFGVYCSDLRGMYYRDESFGIINPTLDGGVPFRFINRSTWDARYPKSKTTFPNPPPNLVIIMHTANYPCSSVRDCSTELRIMQNYHMDTLGFDDIAYNFLIGGDGQTYEGRGWDLEGANAPHFNNRSLGIAFIGYFQDYPPPNNQLEQAKVLISESVKRGKLSQNYKLVGHRQVSETLSPGEALFDILKTWPHWEHCYMSSCEQYS